MENVSSRCGKSDNATRLRFPEFRGEWVEKKLGEIFFEVNERKHPELPVLSIQQGIGTVFRDISERRIAYDKANINAYKVIEPGDFIIHLRSFEGGLECSKHKGISSPAYKILRSNCIDSAAFKDYFRSYNFIEGKLAAAVTGIRDGKNIDMPTFWSLKINIPSLPEQKKIAAFFTLLDRRIQKQRQLVECLKTYKRGVSEAIFERRLNFSSLLATEWKKYKLGQIGEFYNGLSGKSREDFGNGNCKFITYMNVYKNIIADESLCESVKIRKEEEQNSVKYGDVLFTQSSETLEEVGYTSVWTHSSQPYLNSFCFGYRFYDSVMTNPIFIAHYMRSNYIRKAIMKEGQGATRVNLSAERLKNLNIFLPDINGQNKIAEFLSRLENRIHKEESVLEKMSTEKSSLLQKMFI